MENLDEYQDALLLRVFENFRKNIHKTYDLDPSMQ